MDTEQDKPAPPHQSDRPVLKLRDAAGRSVLPGRLAPLCLHRRATIDAEARLVECADCKASLDPIEFLALLAREETRLDRLRESNAAVSKMLDEKRRFKCAHCGKFTDVTKSGRENRYDELREKQSP